MLVYKLTGSGFESSCNHSTFCIIYEKSGIKNVALRSKITSMQWSWVKRLSEYDFQVLQVFLKGKHLGKNFKFYKNIDMSNEILSKFPSFYQDIFIKWISNFTSKSTLPSMILPEVIWFNSNINKVDSKPVQFSFFLKKNLNFIGQLFNDN